MTALTSNRTGRTAVGEPGAAGRAGADGDRRGDEGRPVAGPADTVRVGFDGKGSKFFDLEVT